MHRLDQEYNRLRLLTSEQTSLEGMTFTHAYTSLGHLSSTRYPHGVTVSHAPNALGQPTRVGSFATAATYHPNGALKSFVYGNQLTRTYTQNTRMLVSGIVDRYSTSAALHDFQHVYDQAGNLTSITDGPGIADRTMAYDYLDRLVTANASSLWGLGRYAYDPLDNLREADIGTRKYNYNYATNWRLSTIRTDAGTTVWNFGYDVRGNQTSKGSQSYTFDQANRITAVPGLISTYFYDGHGRRQAEIRATGTARYTLRTKDGLMRGGPDSGKAAGVWHYYLGTQLVATTTNPHSGATPTTAYQHTDHLGSVIRETNSGRGTISQTYYEPYGQPTNRTVDGPGYTGHVMDAPTGLIYMEQRYYDPLVGRFLGIDPIVPSQSTGFNFSRYWYGANNPYKYSDPDGRYACASSERICKRVAKFVEKIRSAVAGSKPDTSDYKRLRAISNYLGVEGDGNGVIIRDKRLSGDSLGEAVDGDVIRIDTEKSDARYGESIHRWNPGLTRADANTLAGAGVLAHEAQHHLDANRPNYDGRTGMPTSADALFPLEQRAYGVQGVLGRTLGRDLGYSTQGAIDAGAKGSVRAWCKNGGSQC